MFGLHVPQVVRFVVTVVHLTDMMVCPLTVTVHKSYSKYQSVHHGNRPRLINSIVRNLNPAALESSQHLYLICRFAEFVP